MFMISPNSRLCCLLAVMLSLVSFSVQAQTSPRVAPAADPLDPLARVPQATYQSPLADYRRLGEDQPVSWREANETVNRIGGWRAYAREGLQREDRPAVSPAPAPGPSDSHHGHAKHGGSPR